VCVCVCGRYKCLDSEYLDESQLHLLRLQPICDEKEKRAPLTPLEKGTLIHAYVEAQTMAVGSRAVAAKKELRETLETDYKKAINKAETEYKGFVWLMNKNVNITNCIYYSHLNSFCFGWKQALSKSAADVITEVLSDFPFSYTIKCNDGTTVNAK